MEEEWVDIKDYEGLYRINRNGDIYSYKSKRLKTQFQMKGVKLKNSRVGLNKNGKTKTFLIEYLLYLMFNIDYSNNSDLEDEIWVDVKGFEGMYKISNKGRVKSLDRYIPQADYTRFMKGSILSTKRNNGHGYCNVSLQCGNDILPKNFYLHILVAEHFLDNPNNYLEVNHIDFNKSRNIVDNLEWCDRVGNIKHLVENRDTHYITNDLKDEILTHTNNGLTTDEISKLTGIEYASVKQIENVNTRRIKVLNKTLDTNN